MTDTKHIRIEDFNYDLPGERIAKFPLARRDDSKLLVYNHGKVGEDVFRNLPAYIPSGTLMVFNNTRVIHARLHFRKGTGALIEVFLLEPLSPADYERVFQATDGCSWLCMIGNLRRWKGGDLSRRINVKGRAVMLSAGMDMDGGASPQCCKIDFRWDDGDVSFADIIEAAGELPIPPYLGRATQASDDITYQTVYSKIKGSVAAPTAGLHFTDGVLSALDGKGVDREELTLHVGAGTFKPVKCSEIEGHEMHTEHVRVNRETIEKLLAHGARATAVGTTCVRTLESLYYMGVRLANNPDLPESQLHVEQWEPYDTRPTLAPEEALRHLLSYMERNGVDALHSSTRIIIAPGYKYKIVDRLITNFHQPRSTLLLLVSAFVNGDWRRIYDYALAHGFRFLSYGDSSLLIP